MSKGAISSLLILAIAVIAVLVVASNLEFSDLFTGEAATASKSTKCKLNAPAISISPSSQEITPGETVEFELTIKNKDRDCPDAAFGAEAAVGASSIISSRKALIYSGYRFTADAGSNDKWLKLTANKAGKPLETLVVDELEWKDFNTVPFSVFLLDINAKPSGKVDSAYIFLHEKDDFKIWFPLETIVTTPPKSSKTVNMTITLSASHVPGSAYPFYTVPVAVVNMGDTEKYMTTSARLYICNEGSATATTGVEWGPYAVYATLGSNEKWAEIVIKNIETNVILDKLKISQDKSKISSTTKLTITLNKVMALEDGTIVGADLKVCRK